MRSIRPLTHPLPAKDIHLPPVPSRRIAWYGATIFLSSAVVMLLEIVAGRLVAPYVGVSLYSWTSIIGVVLAGLSLGNWLGGLWADRGAGERAAGITLALGGLFSLAILLILTLVAPVLQAQPWNLVLLSFLYVGSLFFVPAVLLGVVTPLLTTLALGLDSRTGHVVGRMHALAALGSILGTFATGYWLVQYFGTRAVVIGAALGLFALSAPLLWRSWRPLALLAAIAVGLVWLTHVREGFAEPCERESSYFCIRVIDESYKAPFGQARTLVLDHLAHGTNHASEPTMLIAPYVHLMDELVRQHFGDRYADLRYFFAGGGAYTQPRALQSFAPGARVTVAELDPAVTDTARQSLYLDPQGMSIVHEDARVALERLSGERFDVVVTDVFHDIAIPYHLVTREFVALVKSRLAPDGLYVMNVVDAMPDGRLVKSVVKTLRTQFGHVHLWVDRVTRTPRRYTYVITATDLAEPPRTIEAQRGFGRTWQRATEALLSSGTSLEALPVLADDYAPVDRLLAPVLFGDLGQ